MKLSPLYRSTSFLTYITQSLLYFVGENIHQNILTKLLPHSGNNFTVRLECVMHAASVHPEPGSNSLKNCIFNRNFFLSISFLRAFALALYYLLELLLNSKEFSESTSLLTFPLSRT